MSPIASVALLDAHCPQPIPPKPAGPWGTSSSFSFSPFSLKDEEESILMCEFCGSELQSFLSDVDIFSDNTHPELKKHVSQFEIKLDRGSCVTF